MGVTSCPLAQPDSTCSSISCLTQQHADEIEILLNIQQAITSHLDLNDVLQMIADEARKLTSAKFSFLYVLEGDELCLAALSGTDQNKQAIGYRFPVSASLAGKSIYSGKPIMLSDVQENDPRIYSQALIRFGKIRCYITVPLIYRERPIGAIAVADENNETLGEDSVRVLSMLAPSAVIGLENARLYQEQQERRLEAEGRHQMAESLRVILDIVNSNRSLEETLNYIVSRVGSRLMGCQATAVFVLNSKDGTLSVQAAHGLSSDLATIQSLPGYKIATQVVQTQQPLTISTEQVLGAEEYTNQETTSETNPAASRLHDLYHALLAVPLIVKGKIYGAILMYFTEPRVFSSEEINLALMFSDEVALAIENARLRMEAEQAAVIAERNRLARELHDAVNQTLFSANLIADVLPRLWEKDQANAMVRLEELKQLTHGALAEMRTLLFELRPAVFNEARLGELLKHLTQAISVQSQIPITLTLEGDQKLPPEVQIAFYRITQEALNNVVKHANASKISVELSFASEMVKLSIIDNGCGFDPLKVSSEHFGLSIMQERAATINAKVNVMSKPDCGTQIDITWSGSTTDKH